MNNHKTNKYANDESENLKNDLNTIDFSSKLKNLIEQPNSIAVNQNLNKTTQSNSTNLIDLNTTRLTNGTKYLNDYKQNENDYENDLTDYNSEKTDTKNNKEQSPITNKDNQLNGQPDNRKFLTKDIDIFDFEHLNKRQTSVSLSDNDNENKFKDKFKNLNNFTVNSTFKLPFDSKPAVIQSNNFEETNSKFNLGYQEQASIEISNNNRVSLTKP